MLSTGVFADDAFRLYVGLSAGIMASAGCAIAMLKRWAHVRASHATNALKGWLFMVPLIALAVGLGPIVAVALFASLAVIAFIEYARVVGFAQDRVMKAVGCAGIVALALASIGPDSYFTPTFVAAAAVIVLVPVVTNRPSGRLAPSALALLGLGLLGGMFGHLFRLAASTDHLNELLYLIFAVEIADVSAFAFGKAFGRTKMCARVSPNKTWEGSIGSLAVSLALPFLLSDVLPGLSAIQLLLIGGSVGVGGQLGDLVASAIKREAGVKDMGDCIPGHGGVFDRIDSLVGAVPLFFWVVTL